MIQPILHKDLFPVEAVKPVSCPNMHNIFECIKQKSDNRLRDSAQLFGDMLRSKYLSAAAFILFLNKAKYNQSLSVYLYFFRKIFSGRNFRTIHWTNTWTHTVSSYSIMVFRVFIFRRNKQWGRCGVSQAIFSQGEQNKYSETYTRSCSHVNIEQIFFKFICVL